MEFSAIEIDKLKEIVNIIEGNSNTSLSKMLDKKINMIVPNAFAGSIEKVHQKLKGDDEVVSAIFLKIHGDLNGAMLLTFCAKSAVNLAKLLGKGTVEISDLREFDKSALVEVGNILFGTSANVLADYLGLNIGYSVPNIATDMQGAIMDSVLTEIEEDFGKTLALETDINVEGENINGKVYYLFDKESTRKLLETIKSK